jgi:thiol-disulfide isomerase/thioredoxin
MARIVLALAAACGAAASAQTPDAQMVLEAAAESMRSLRTATYEARLELRGGTSWRIVTGRVQLAKFDYCDPIGGRLAVRGEITRSSSPDGEPFEAVYDGQWMRWLRADKGVLLEGQAGYGGEELLQGSFGAIVCRALLEADPLAALQGASEVTSSGRTEIDGVPCDVVEARLDDSGRTVRWSIGVEDRLPRRIRQTFRSARGNEVESELTLSNLRVDTEFDPAVFQIVAPEGITVERVGRKPPPPLNVGDLAPDWTLNGSDGRPHKLSDYRGRLVVLEFWSSECKYCLWAMPAMQLMHDMFADRGVAFFSANCREKGDVDPVAFVRKRGFTYTVLVGGNEITPAYRVGGIPAFYLIGPEGRLLHRQSGFSEEAERRLIEFIERYAEE